MDPRTDLFKNKTFLDVRDPFPIRTITLGNETIPNASVPSTIIGRAAVKGNKEERFEALNSLYYDDATISAKHLNLYFNKVIQPVTEKNSDDYDMADGDLEQLAGLNPEKTHTVVLVRDVSQHGVMVLRHQHTKPIILEKGKLDYLLNGDVVGLVVLDKRTPIGESNCFDIFRDTKVQFQVATDYKDKFSLIKLDTAAFLSIDTVFKNKLTELESSSDFILVRSGFEDAKFEIAIGKLKSFIEDTFSYSKRIWMYTPCAIDFTDHVFRNNYASDSSQESLEECIKMFITVDCEDFLPELESLVRELGKSEYSSKSSEIETPESIYNEVTPGADSDLDLRIESDYEIDSQSDADSIVELNSQVSASSSSNIIDTAVEVELSKETTPDIEIITEVKREGTSSDDPSLLKKNNNSFDHPIELDTSTPAPESASSTNAPNIYSTENGPVVIDRETTSDNPIIIDHDLSSGKDIIIDLLKRPLPGNVKIDIQPVPGFGGYAAAPRYMEELKLKLQQRNEKDQKKSVALTVSDLVNPVVKSTKILSVQDMINNDERECEENDEDYKEEYEESDEDMDFTEEEEEYSNDVVPFSEIGKKFIDVQFEKDPKDDEAYVSSEQYSDDSDNQDYDYDYDYDSDFETPEMSNLGVIPYHCVPCNTLSAQQKSDKIKAIISGNPYISYDTSYYSAVQEELIKFLRSKYMTAGLASLLNEQIESSDNDDYNSEDEDEEEQQDDDTEEEDNDSSDSSDVSDDHEEDAESSENELFSSKSSDSDLEADRSNIDLINRDFCQEESGRKSDSSAINLYKRKRRYDCNFNCYKSTAGRIMSCPRQVHSSQMSSSSEEESEEEVNPTLSSMRKLTGGSGLIFEDDESQESEGFIFEPEDDTEIHLSTEDGPALKKLKLEEAHNILEVEQLKKKLEDTNQRLSEYQARRNTEARRTLKDKLKSVALGMLIGSVGTVSALVKLSSSLPNDTP